MNSGIWDWDYAWAALPSMLEAFFKVTLLVTVAGSAIAATLGLIIAILRRGSSGILGGILTFVVNFIRMTPIVVQLLFAFYVLTDLSPITIGIIIFGIHYATYMAEVYRAGIDAVPVGQWEATRALSMSKGRTWWAVIIPQALRSTIPALGNYVVSMFKDTPFLISITVVEVVRAAQIFGGQNFRYTEAITLAGVIYLLASYPTSLLIGRLEKRLAYSV